MSLRGARPTEDRKAEFLNWMGAAYDKYVQKMEQTPDALVCVLGGLKQPARADWLIQGESRGGGTSVLALAHATIIRELVE